MRSDSMRFTDTKNKRRIRRYDKKIIEEYCTKKGKKLSYFGLTGAKMLDILEWKDYLEIWVAVEVDDEDYSELNFTALENNLASGLTAIEGDIDDVLIGSINDRVKFPLEVFNLDYSGGALYKNKEGEAKRLKGWESLIRRQSEHKHDFLLFLTLNSREKDEGEIDGVLTEMQHRLKDEEKSKLATIIQEGKKRDKFKVYIPSLIAQYAASRKYKLNCYPPICYTGSSSIPMIHFVFELEFKKGRASPLFPLPLEQIMDIPLYWCENGVICNEKGEEI